MFSAVFLCPGWVSSGLFVFLVYSRVRDSGSNGKHLKERRPLFSAVSSHRAISGRLAVPRVADVVRISLTS